ncbi:hypothetical protein HT102_13045 [Hoyosella sp. G463]|uniref:Teichuronopeptide biosynthesis TupA-like protein n=1 Tax=Lolliginicoccus lacisalsi TaxID=2742202 RepID=A0A927PMW8_9ACTN|nr:ATP-grasp fold amidoligase family protein [Lolliginicoccus lacisalsi]MBD8507409.1 hypothetical protein [Lolliginicoccus lacisalsi]
MIRAASAQRAANTALGHALGAMPLALRRQVMYAVTHQGRLANLRSPELFTHKVNWRMLHDRREILKPTCDKVLMKEIVRERLGGRIGIPRILWAGSSLGQARQAPAETWESPWVLKPAHRSQRIIVGTGAPDIDELMDQTRGWMDQPNWTVLGEWAYQFATPRFIFEERLGDGTTLPPDFKFLVFHGVPRFIIVEANRQDELTVNYYTPDWVRQEVPVDTPAGPDIPRPRGLDTMLALAAEIAHGFDFLRVDLYEIDGEILFGETTPYPVGGLSKYPEWLDRQLGSYWELPDLANA